MCGWKKLATDKSRTGCAKFPEFRWRHHVGLPSPRGFGRIEPGEAIGGAVDRPSDVSGDAYSVRSTTMIFA